MVDITGLDKGAVLAALYNKSQTPWPTSQHMTAKQANELLKSKTYFDYLEGRVMKVELLPDANAFDERLYDRDNGQGAAQSVIDALRSGR